MLELTNLSNADCDVEKVLENDAGTIPAIVREHGLDGIEFMICGPWDRVMHPPQYIKGVHLLFWPCWLDFWRGNRAVLLSEFGSEENIRAYYGSLDVGDWVEAWKRNLRQAARCHPHYVVFHVAHNRTSEMYTREFSASDEDVIRATAELVNQITSELPQGPHLAAMLLEQVDYPNTGFMLDTGHLMNTNFNLRNETDGAAYVQKIYRELGALGQYVYGVHLHQSISGSYTREMMRLHAGEHRPLTWGEAMDYVMHVDLHQPFRTDAALRILDAVQPEYLVHEFQHRSRGDLEDKLRVQRGALNFL